MRHKEQVLALVLSLVLPSELLSQGTFQNLDFESASLVPIPGDRYNRVQFGPAFPGWTGYVGGVQETAALYHNAFLDSSGICIIDSSFSFPTLPGAAQRINGNFAAILQAGLTLNTTGLADTTLAQSGLIPSGTQSLLFNAYLFPGVIPGAFGVTLGGQLLTLLPIHSDANSTLYGADIRSWAGQSAELAFTAYATRPGSTGLFLDSIQFSNQPIPEPSVFGLFALGALLLGWRFLKRTS